VVFAPELAPEVGPELLEDVPGHVDAELHAKLRDPVARSAIIRIIRIGDGDGGRIACDFGKVKLCSTRIALGPENPAHRVAEPGQSTTCAAPEVARVLMKQRGKYRLGHVVADHEVAIRRAEIPAVSGDALAKGSVAVRQLSFAREERRQCDGPAVEGVLCRQLELLGGVSGS